MNFKKSYDIEFSSFNHISSVIAAYDLIINDYNQVDDDLDNQHGSDDVSNFVLSHWLSNNYLFVRQESHLIGEHAKAKEKIA